MRIPMPMPTLAAPLPHAPSRSVAWLDAAERLIILALYAWLVARVVAALSAGGLLVNGLLLISEGLVVVFMLARRPAADLSRRPIDWLLALGATCAPLLVTPGRGVPLIPPGIAAALWLLGTGLQVAAKVALGRSFGCVPAHRGLKRGGPYRWVRHPMYAGYLLAHVAFLLLNPTPGNLALYLVCDAIQVPRLLIEERRLGRDRAYRDYCEAVRWRVVPGVF